MTDDHTEAGPPGWTVEEELASYNAALIERLGFTKEQIDEADGGKGPLITLAQVATLGGLARNSPGAARQRTMRGQAKVPFPDADEEWLKRMPYVPLFPAYDILDYFIATGNWPLGQAARMAQRHPRPGAKTPAAAPEDKITFTRLAELHPRVAQLIRRKGLNDGSRRSPAQWKHRARSAA